MIHPQYIVALCDCDFTTFKISLIQDKFQFEVNIYSNSIQILYKIKERFKTGKVIQINDPNKNYCLKIKKQLDIIIKFYLKNHPLNKLKYLEFLRWQYLYTKLIIENNNIKTDKEIKRISKRLKYFCVI